MDRNDGDRPGGAPRPPAPRPISPRPKSTEEYPELPTHALDRIDAIFGAAMRRRAAAQTTDVEHARAA